MPKSKIEILKEKLNDPNQSEEVKKAIKEKIRVLENNLTITK